MAVPQKTLGLNSRRQKLTELCRWPLPSLYLGSCERLQSTHVLAAFGGLFGEEVLDSPSDEDFLGTMSSGPILFPDILLFE